MTSKKLKVSVEYEGMGAGIEADIFILGKRVCKISSSSPKTNKKTQKIIDLLVAALEVGQ